MDHDEYRELVPPDFTCRACGKPADLGSTNTLIEPIEHPGTPGGEGIVWHRDCFNAFLDEGEET